MGAFIEWLPRGALAAVTDGGRLAAAAAVAWRSLLLGSVLCGWRSGASSAANQNSCLSAWWRSPAWPFSTPGELVERHSRGSDRGGLDVYVSLPFQGADDESFDELLGISADYPRDPGDVFSGVESVNIMPPDYDSEVLRGNPPQCTYQRAEVWCRGVASSQYWFSATT